MDRKEAILRIKEHMKHHGIGKYPHLKLKEALDMAIAARSQPNEPLTLEQLREMDGEPVWIEDVKHWALIDIEKGGQWDGMPFAVWAENGVKFTYNVESRDLHCYRRPPEGEEETRWTTLEAALKGEQHERG